VVREGLGVGGRNDPSLVCNMNNKTIKKKKKSTNNRCWYGCRGKRNFHILLVVMQASKTTLENNMESS
jgi:hypothetical protein